VCYSRPMVYAYVPDIVSISLFCRPLAAKNTTFCHFWTLAFNWQQSEKAEHGCTTTNLPLSNGIKIVSVLQRLHGEIGHTDSDVLFKSMTDRQTNKSSAVAEMGDRSTTIDMDRKVGRVCCRGSWVTI